MESSLARRTLSNLVLGVGFGLTGAGTVMLGVLLPEFSKLFGLRDDTAGLLFLLQFLGASSGAVIIGANHLRWLAIGYSLLVVSACALAFAGLPLVFPVFYFFGLGLGITMTATSLVFSDRYREDCAAKLQRLNFAWAIGATTAPVLFLPYLRMATLRPLFFTFVGLFLALLAWVLIRERHVAHVSQPAAHDSLSQNLRPQISLLLLVVLATCAVGVEVSISGWLTTYSKRAGETHTVGTVLAISLFWIGMTLSRFLFSTRLLAIVGNRRTMRMALWCLAASVAILIAAHTPATIQICAVLAGLSLGPLYPLALSFMLEITGRGWIFAVGGVGAAVFPWFTGLVSAHFGSLHYGLVVPCGAAILMLALASIGLRDLKHSMPPAASRR